jgi:hypothetical protein
MTAVRRDAGTLAAARRILVPLGRGPGSRRLGPSVARASWLIGVSVRRYRELKDGDSYPDFETWGQDLQAVRWSQTFVI